jgi:hypothetical protein
MRFAFITLLVLAGSLLASQANCDKKSCADCLAGTSAGKVAATSGKDSPALNSKKKADSAATDRPRIREGRLAPAAKPCRPAYLFM